MKKLILLVFLVMIFLVAGITGFVLAAESGTCGNGICEEGENLRVRCPTSNCEGDNCPQCQKACEQDCGKDKMKKARIGEKEIETELEIEEGKENNQSKLKVKLSNGKNSEIKVMPSTANARAIERLGLKVCNIDNNCTIVLKETGKGNETRAVYEVQVERHYRILALFKAKAQNKAEVDAETGEVVVTKKPWWAFLASEAKEEE